MSILPKRTKRNGEVTIHLGIGILHQLNGVRFAHLKTIVKTPSGKEDTLLNKHIQLLPNSGIYKETNIANINQENALSRNTPLLLLADFLSNKNRNREQLIHILEKLYSIRHFYFHYKIPENGEIGKYEIFTKVFLDGEESGSATQNEDFFFVEEISVLETKTINGILNLKIENKSPENTPIKLVTYTNDNIIEQVIQLNGNEQKDISCGVDSFITYNEEREIICLKNFNQKVSIRNPKIKWIEKENNEEVKIYLFPEEHNDDDTCFILEKEGVEIWQKSTGEYSCSEIRNINEELYDNLIKHKLLVEL